LSEEGVQRMNGEVNEIVLKGCAPVPLAHYLKALGILRLVSEQVDPEARGYWKNDVFVLRTKMSKDELVDFFLNDYEPTPIVAPWNGRGGFLEGEEKGKSKRAGAQMIQMFGESDIKRFTKYKEVVSILKQNQVITGLNKIRSSRKELEKKKNILEKMKKKDGLTNNEIDQLDALKEKIALEINREKKLKTELLFSLRSTMPDNALNWMDSCLVLSGNIEDNPSMSPLLGAGGVDGSQDFSVNFMQRLCDVINISDGTAKDGSDKYLENSLFSMPGHNLLKGAAIGQFFPTATGGKNSSNGFDSDSMVNPWDYILMLEGTLLFVSSCAKKLESEEAGSISAPFCVRQTGVGYGSAAQNDEKSSRAEIWVPFWETPASHIEIGSLMSEGRARLKRRSARNGVDFARAIAGLGVDRGISSFQRYGFQKRNGDNNFAIPLGRFQVRRQPQADILYEIDNWLNIFRRKATSDKAPASAGRALRNLENSILSLCKSKGPSRVQEVLISLGNCEKTMATSFKWTTKTAHLKPIPLLSPKWIHEADDGSPEFRLATSLASVSGKYKDDKGKTVDIPVRFQIEPVDVFFKERDVSWNKKAGREVVSIQWNLVEVLNAIMTRRILKTQQSEATSFPDWGRQYASFGDISDFIEGRVNYEKISELLLGLILIDWPSAKIDLIQRRANGSDVFPSATYGLLKLCFGKGMIRNIEIPLVPQIHKLAVNGDSVRATELASRRLRGSGLTSAITTVHASKEHMQRIAAALLFPISNSQRAMLAERILRPE